MAAVEQQILVKIKALVDGLPQVQELAHAVNSLNKGGSGFKRIGQDADDTAKKVGGLTFRIKDTEKSLLGVAVKGSGAASVLLSAGAAAATFGAALAAIGAGAAALGFGAFVAEGIRFNAVIESAKIGIATIVSNTYDVVDAQGKVLAPQEAFNASLVQSEELERGLQKAAILTKFEFEDILGFFNSTVIASAGLNTNLNQILRLTQDFALAAGAANIETQLVRTGIQQILTGNVTVRNPLARVLFPGQTTAQINKFLKDGRAAGDLVDRLEKKLQVFRLSADQVAQSFDAVLSNVFDTLKLFAAQATLPLFDKLKSALGNIIKQVVDLSGDVVKLTPKFQSIADLLGVIFSFLGDQMAGAVDYIFEVIKDWVAYFEANKETLGEILINVYAIGEQIAGIALDLISIVGNIGKANSDTSNWATLTLYVALLFGLIRDVLNVILGVFEGIAGVLSISISTFLSYISDTLASIIQNTGSWLDALIPVAITIDRIAQGLGAAGASIANSGTDRLLSGLDNEGFIGAQNRINTPFKNPFAAPNKPSTNTFRRRKSAGGAGDGEGGKAARAAKERINNAKKLYDAIETLQIANANREVELAKLVNAQLQTLNKRRYDQGLISTEDYFAKKAELELDDLKRQEASLKKQEGFANDALSRDLGAISGKFSLNEEEIQAVIEQIRVAQEAPGALKGANPIILRQAIEYTKYLEQTAKITSDLRKIEKEREDIATGTTDAIKDQARVRLQQRNDIKGELANTLGQDGVAASLALKKRISDELGKHLVDENKGVPGIEAASAAIRDLGSIDISGVTDQLKIAGIDVDSLSEDTQNLLKLFRALALAIDLNATNAIAGKIKSRADFDRDGVSSAFESGAVNSADALAANAAIKKQVISDLTAQYNKLKAALDVVSADGGIVDPSQLDSANALYRLIQGITQDYGELALIQKQADRDAQTFSLTSDSIEARRISGAIGSKQARAELKIAQEEAIAGLQRELAELLKLDQALPDVALKVAGVQGQIATMTNDVNSESISLAQSINGTIGDAFSTFLDNIQSGTQSIGDSFRQLVAGLLLGIAKAIAQAILLKFILAPLGLTGGDSGGIGGLFSGLLKKADGGIISGKGTGVSDSIPAMLSDGEGIIPAARVKGYGRGMIQSIIDGTFLPIQRFAHFAVGGFAGRDGGSGGGGRGVRIINSLDPNLVKEFMSSAAGEEIVTNIIGKNPGLIQRIV